MQCTDKQGNPFEITQYDHDHFAFLEAMYTSFFPKGKFQGMPPLKDKTSRLWMQRLLENGENFLAWQSGKTIGHVVVLPDLRKKDAEYLIFVSHPNRGRGIGSELTRIVLEHAKRLGVETIWLVVGATNFQAIGLYKKFGFVFCSQDFSETEREMVLKL